MNLLSPRADLIAASLACLGVALIRHTWLQGRARFAAAVDRVAGDET